MKRALDSLQGQSYNNFELIFIDYGSDPEIAENAKKTVQLYSFAKYYYNDTRGWFWNRAHALNAGIKLASGDVCLFYDIDLILDTNFLQRLCHLNFVNYFYTFSCFYLPEEFDIMDRNVFEDGIHLEQDYVGLCAVKKDVVMNIQGFDEYYMVWGGEDDDIYKRLEAFGINRKHMTGVNYKAFHQWHSPQSPVTPSMWYLTMVNYLYTKEKSNTRPSGWGKMYESEDREMLKVITECRDYKSCKRLQFWEDQPLLYFNPFIENFYQLLPGETAYLEYEFKSRKRRSRLFSLVHLAGLGSSRQRLEEKNVEDFFHYFIGINCSLLSDYFFRSSEERVLFLCNKK